MAVDERLSFFVAKSSTAAAVRLVPVSGEPHTNCCTAMPRRSPQLWTTKCARREDFAVAVPAAYQFFIALTSGASASRFTSVKPMAGRLRSTFHVVEADTKTAPAMTMVCSDAAASSPQT